MKLNVLFRSVVMEKNKKTKREVEEALAITPFVITAIYQMRHVIWCLFVQYAVTASQPTFGFELTLGSLKLWFHYLGAIYRLKNELHS